MKTIFRFLFLLALSASFCTVAYAGDVVKDTLGTTSSSVKSVEQLLQGQVAGVRVWSQDGSPLSASGVTIRGVNSLRGGQQPLYIVDGTILNDSNTKNSDPFWQYGDVNYASPLSQLSFLTPNDIESIEVLKNASATALYGSKGANGVVIINTKRIRDNRSVITWDSNLDLAAPIVKDGTALGISHNHRVMLGGSKNKTSYTLSGYFRDDNYVIPGTGSMKGGLRASFDTQANQVVWFGLSSNFTVGNTKSASATTWYGKDSYTVNMRNPEATIDGWAADFDDHALDFRTVNSMYLQLNLLKGFTFKADIGADYQYTTRNFWWGNGVSFGLENNGAAAILKTSSFAYNGSAVFRYNEVFSDDHHLDVSLGAQAVGSWDVFNTLNGTDFYNHSIRYKSLNIAGSKAKIHYFPRNILNAGITASASYDYKDVVGINAAIRTDINPEFGSWNKYPSVYAYWDLGRHFLSDTPVNTLKLEAGYGESGRDDVIPYESLGLYTTGEYVEVNPNATPFFDGRSYIHSREWHVGITYGMFDDRLSVSATYYNRKTTDRLSMYANGEELMTTPPESSEEEEGNESEEGEEGGGQVFVPEHRFWQWKDREEIASQESVVSSNGIEVSLTGVPVQTEDWTWSINVNGAYNFNRISKLAVEDKGGMGIGGGIIATQNRQGDPVSSIVDENGSYLGNPTPKYYGGFSTALSWKDLTLDVLADGAAGYNILNLNAMAADKQTAVSSKYVEKGDFLRLARVSLAYKFDMKNIKWMESIKVFATACNLAVFSDYSGWSPDVNSYAASNFRLGMDYGSYPAARSFVLGLSVKF